MAVLAEEIFEMRDQLIHLLATSFATHIAEVDRETVVDNVLTELEKLEPEGRTAENIATLFKGGTIDNDVCDEIGTEMFRLIEQIESAEAAAAAAAQAEADRLAAEAAARAEADAEAAEARAEADAEAAEARAEADREAAAAQAEADRLAAEAAARAEADAEAAEARAEADRVAAAARAEADREAAAARAEADREAAAARAEADREATEAEAEAQAQRDLAAARGDGFWSKHSKWIIPGVIIGVLLTMIVGGIWWLSGDDDPADDSSKKPEVTEINKPGPKVSGYSQKLTDVGTRVEKLELGHKKQGKRITKLEEHPSGFGDPVCAGGLSACIARQMEVAFDDDDLREFSASEREGMAKRSCLEFEGCTHIDGATVHLDY